MFFCSPVFPVWEDFSLETCLGRLEGAIDRSTRTLKFVRFVDSVATASRRRSGEDPLLSFLRDRRSVRILQSDSPFFQRVYNALVEVPPGQTVTYGELAARAGNPRASRAVGQAMSRNALALLIPCHRVLPSGGGLGSYRWGVRRKMGLLEMEKGGRDAWDLLIGSVSLQKT